VRFSAREDVLSITPFNPFDRFDDGHPRVPDDLIERMKLVTAEEAWIRVRLKYMVGEMGEMRSKPTFRSGASSARAKQRAD